MTNIWDPKEEDHAVIKRSIESISNELAELQDANFFIIQIANKVVSEYKTNQNIIIRDEE